MLWFNRHRRFRDKLSAYLDEQLRPDELAALKSHLAACPSCSAELEELRLTVAALRELPVEPAPRSFALTPEQVAPRPPSPVRAPSPALTYGMRTAGAALAVALAVVLVIDVSDSGGNQGGVSTMNDYGVGAERNADSSGALAPGATTQALAPTPTLAPGATGQAGGGGVGGVTAITPTPGTSGNFSATPEPAPAGRQVAETTPGEEEAAGALPQASPAGLPATNQQAETGDGLDTLRLAEIALAGALALVIAGAIALAIAGRREAT